MLRRRRTQAAWGRIPIDGVYPLCPTFDTVGPIARPSPTSRLPGRCSPARRCRPPVSTASTSGCSRGRRRSAARRFRRTAPQSSTSSARVARRTRRRGRDPGAVRRYLAALLSRSRRVASRDLSRARRRVRRQRAREARARADDRSAEVEQARAAIARWREYVPPVDLYVAPVLGVDYRRSTATSSRCDCR